MRQQRYCARTAMKSQKQDVGRGQGHLSCNKCVMGNVMLTSLQQDVFLGTEHY